MRWEIRVLDPVAAPDSRRMKRAVADPEKLSEPGSESLDIEHLAVAIISARRASDVRWHFAAAFGAILEDGCTPALCATAHFLTAFGLAALWNGHGLASC